MKNFGLRNSVEAAILMGAGLRADLQKIAKMAEEEKKRKEKRKEIKKSKDAGKKELQAQRGRPRVDVPFTTRTEPDLLFCTNQRNVPWINTKYEIFRQDNPGDEFKLIGISTEEFYIDSGLVNEKEYCYKLKSEGEYFINNNLYRLEFKNFNY